MSSGNQNPAQTQPAPPRMSKTAKKTGFAIVALLVLAIGVVAAQCLWNSTRPRDTAAKRDIRHERNTGAYFGHIYMGFDPEGDSPRCLEPGFGIVIRHLRRCFTAPQN